MKVVCLSWFKTNVVGLCEEAKLAINGLFVAVLTLELILQTRCSRKGSGFLGRVFEFRMG